jgi:hypothetical protein
MNSKAIITTYVGLLFALQSGCSDPPVWPGGAPDVAHVDGYTIKVSRAHAWRDGMPGSGRDHPLTVSVTLEEVSGRSLAHCTVETISVLHDMGHWLPADVKTYHSSASPHIVSGKVRGGPAWRGLVYLYIAVHSAEFGTAELWATTKVQVAY